MNNKNHQFNSFMDFLSKQICNWLVTNWLIIIHIWIQLFPKY